MGTESTEPGGISGPSADMILVVEDDESTSRLERIVLADEGYSVACAGSGEEALEMLTNTAPSLVILDIQLPRMDGFTTCQEIRERSQVPIIMVTGEGRDEDKVRGLEMGADDYITKPFSTIELVARVVVVLRRTRIQRIHRTRTTTTRPTPSWPEMPILEHPPSPEIREKTAGIPTFGLMVSGGDSSGDSSSCDSSSRSYGKDQAPSVPDSTGMGIDADGNNNYEGAVKLEVETNGAVKELVRFVETLRENPQIHLIRLVSNQKKSGMNVWLRLRSPTPLRATLVAAAGVSEVAAAEPSEFDPETAVIKVSLT